MSASPPAATPRVWHALDVDAVERELSTGPDGLADAEAARRLEEHGPNEVPSTPEEPWWRVLVRQFQDPLIYILIVAAGVTAAMDDLTDAGVILAVVLINAAIGLWQELRARSAMRALASMSAPHAIVLRGGATVDIEGREVVPGDVVVLASGDRVPADLRLTVVHDLEVDESALTGESVSVRKAVDPIREERIVAGDMLSLAFAGTVVTRGRARGVAVRTGIDSELGRIAVAVREIGDTSTPLQQTMHRFGRLIGLAIVILCIPVVGVGLARGMEPAEIFVAAVALAVAAIPEGLPVVLTVTLAIGVSRMARRGAIVRALPAVETLGSTTVICSDKTGTLTVNEMTVRSIWAGGVRYEGSDALLRDGRPAEPDEDPPLAATLLAGVLANEAGAEAFGRGEASGDPTELALYAVASRAGVDPLRARREHRELDILPFESDARYMATLNAASGLHRIHLKGAPEVIVERCERMLEGAGSVPIRRDEVREAAEGLAAEGLRVLAMAYLDTEGDRLDGAALAGGWTLCGLQGMEDPVRPEAVEAVRSAGDAGIRVLMLTGDHVDTARAIGRQLGLDRGDAVAGAAIERMSDDELDRALRESDVYASSSPSPATA
jgi:calcium-translocating P-type ATPase